MLVKGDIFWSYLAAEIEVFQLYLVTTTYGDNAMAEGKSDLWTVFLTMVRVIYQDLIKSQVEAETAYG